MPDEEKPLTSEGESNQQDDSQHSEASADTGGENDADVKPGSRAQQRIQQLVREKNEIKNIADWYQTNIGNPDDVIAFRQWKSEQMKAAEKAEDAGDISPKQLAAIKALLEKADPDLKALKEERQREISDRFEAMIESSEEEIRDLCKDSGIEDEKKIRFIARNVMLTIKEDEKLLRMWRTGNLISVKRAFKTIHDEYLGMAGKGNGKPTNKEIAGQKRQVSKLPSLSGGSPSVTPKPPAQQASKGITKDTHSSAWDLIQSMAQD